MMLTIRFFICDTWLQMEKVFFMMRTYLHLLNSENYPIVDMPTYEELEEKIEKLEEEIVGLRERDKKLTIELEQLKFRYRRRTLWLMKIIDELNMEVEEVKQIQTISQKHA